MYEKDGLLVYVQVDHLSGEILGSAIEMLYSAGAHNVNVISAITKKNRPGSLFLIDVSPSQVDAVEEVVRRELGTSGWHRINTIHCHVAVQCIEKKLYIKGRDFGFDFLAEGKAIKGDKQSTRPENRSCILLKDRLEKEHGLNISLREIYRLFSEALQQDDQSEIFIQEKIFI